MIPPEYMSFHPAVTVGCVNFERGATKAESLKMIDAAIGEAAAQGINVLVLPELALTGGIECSCRFDGGACSSHRDLAETVPGPASKHIAAMAAEFDMYVVFGMCERDAADASVLYNAAVVVGPEGILGTYRKLHLGTLPLMTEGITYCPGSSLPLFATRFGPMGVLIDQDFAFNPELSRLLMLKGARVLMNLAGTLGGPGRRDEFVYTAAARAQENLVYTASANLVGGAERTEHSAGSPGDPNADHYLGHSVITGPAFPRYNHVFAEAGDTVEIVSATLNFEKLHRWDSVLPVRQWRSGRQLAASRLIADEFAALAQEAAITTV